MCNTCECVRAIYIVVLGKKLEGYRILSVFGDSDEAEKESKRLIEENDIVESSEMYIKVIAWSANHDTRNSSACDISRRIPGGDTA